MTRLAIIAALLAAPVAAETPCRALADMAAGLARNYGETQRGHGLSAQGTLLTLWLSDSGTWTVTTTTPDGLTCIRSFGDGWEGIAVPVPGEPT